MTYEEACIEKCEIIKKMFLLHNQLLGCKKRIQELDIIINKNDFLKKGSTTKKGEKNVK